MRIGLVGTQSVGKSTLLKALKEEYPLHTFVEEATRWVIPLGFKINREADYKTQEMIMMRHLFELEGSKESLTDHTFFDRTPLDCYVYSWWLYSNKQEAMPLEVIEKIFNCFTNTVKDIDLYIYIPIEFKVVDDGVRDLDENYRSEIDGLFQAALNTVVPTTKILKVTGSVENRVNMVKERLQYV